MKNVAEVNRFPGLQLAAAIIEGYQSTILIETRPSGLPRPDSPDFLLGCHVPGDQKAFGVNRKQELPVLGEGHVLYIVLKSPQAFPDYLAGKRIDQQYDAASSAPSDGKPTAVRA